MNTKNQTQVLAGLNASVACKRLLGSSMVNPLGKSSQSLNRTAAVGGKLKWAKKMSVPSLKKGKSKAELRNNQKDFPEVKSLTRVLYSQLREKVAQMSHKRNAFPMAPERALKLFPNQLTNHEKEEILGYETVYYIGHNADKTVYTTSFNDGYDDRKGNYKAALRDHIAYRYEVIGLLGKGSFGQALKCHDHKNQEAVAVKIIKNNKKILKQVEVEVKVLSYIRDNDPNDEFSIVRLKEAFVFRSHYVLFP